MTPDTTWTERTRQRALNAALLKGLSLNQSLDYATALTKRANEGQSSLSDSDKRALAAYDQRP